MTLRSTSTGSSPASRSGISTVSVSPGLARNRNSSCAVSPRRGLQTFGVLETGHLDQNAIIAPAAGCSARWFPGASIRRRQDLYRLLKGTNDAFVQAPLFGQGEANQSVILFVDGQCRGAGLPERGIDERLGQIAQAWHHPFTGGLVGYPQLDRAVADPDTALERGAGLAQEVADLVADLGRFLLEQLLRIHLQQHVRAALEVQPEHDRPVGHEDPGDPAGSGARNGFALLDRKKIRHGQIHAEKQGQQNGHRFGGRDAHHAGAILWGSRRFPSSPPWRPPC